MPNQSEMRVITTLTKDQLDLMKCSAVVVTDRYGKKYYHLPQWYGELENGEFDVLNFDDLPEHVKEDLKDIIPNEIIHY